MPGDWERGREKALPRVLRELLEAMEISIILAVVMVAQMYTCVSTDQTAIFKHVQFMVCQLYLH